MSQPRPTELWEQNHAASIWKSSQVFNGELNWQMFQTAESGRLYKLARDNNIRAQNRRNWLRRICSIKLHFSQNKHYWLIASNQHSTWCSVSRLFSCRLLSSFSTVLLQEQQYCGDNLVVTAPLPLCVKNGVLYHRTSETITSQPLSVLQRNLPGLDWIPLSTMTLLMSITP